MRLVRHIVTIWMLVIILPWGAYVTAATTHPQIDIQTSGMLRPDVYKSKTGWDVVENSPSKVSATRKCRVATLPGFPCSPDPVLELTTSAPSMGWLKQAALRTDVWARQGWSEPPPNYPPRSF